MTTARSGRLAHLIFNTGWIVADRGLRMSAAFVVAIVLARRLGPADFGTYSYVVAFVSLFGFLSSLGLPGIVTRDLSLARDDRNAILGTTFALKVAGGVAAAVIATVVSLLLTPDKRVAGLVMLASCALMLESSHTITLWFEAMLKARLATFPRVAANVVWAACVVVLVHEGASLFLVLGLWVLQRAVQALGLALAYLASTGRFAAWTFEAHRAKDLIKQAFPLILAAAGSVIYLKIDQVMLGIMIDSREVGIYSAAVQLSESWGYLGAAIGTTLLPYLATLRASQPKQYRRRIRAAYSVLIFLGLAIAATMAVAAVPIVRLLFGDAYAASAQILVVHIWALPAIFAGVVVGRWVVIERLYWFTLFRHLGAAALNIGLNLVLIPRYGALGAAWATLVSYYVAYVLSTLATAETRVAAADIAYGMIMPFQLLTGALRPRALP